MLYRVGSRMRNDGADEMIPAECLTTNSRHEKLLVTADLLPPNLKKKKLTNCGSHFGYSVERYELTETDMSCELRLFSK